MKKLILFFVALALISFKQQEINNDKSYSDRIIQLNDKEFLLEYFRETSENLQKNVEGLSEEQLQYKTSEENWSVSQCLEHIILTEKMLFHMVQELMEQPENPERREDVKNTDEELITGMMDRSKKFKASEELQPTGIYMSADEALMNFQQQRTKIIAYINNSSGNMRNHIIDFPAGVFDAYQTLLFTAGHTARHTSQIEEVKTSADFPSE